MTTKKRPAPGWPMIALVAIVAAVILASYWMPVEVRAEMREDALWFWGIAGTFLGPAIRLKIREATGTASREERRGDAS